MEGTSQHIGKCCNEQRQANDNTKRVVVCTVRREHLTVTTGDGEQKMDVNEKLRKD